MPAFLTGVGLGLTGGILGGSIGFAGASALGIGTIVGSFIAANAVTLLVGVSSLAIAAYQNSRPMAASQVNIKVAAGPRWHHMGRNKAGGQVVFADFDATGALWVVIYHSDSELVGSFTYLLDDVEVTVDGGGVVTSTEFQSETEGFLGLLPGETKPFFTLWTRTHTPADRVPPRVTELDTAFPEWDANHKMVGTTFSVMKVDAIDKKSKSNVYKWKQGALGLGDPGISVIGDWGRAYDPRVAAAQDIEDESTWEPTKNPILIGAWNRYRPWGFDRPTDEIDWTTIADEADICDATWVNKYAETLPTYECSVAFSEDKTNVACELDILLACDGSVFFDDTGKWYMEAGRYTAPTLTLSSDRDIIEIESRDIEDGEAAMDGVVVRYIDESLGFIETLSAPWVNTDFFVEGTTPRYREISIPAIRNHSLACKAAKILGSRAQALLKVGIVVGSRGILATNQRLVTIDAGDDDPELSGVYQIVTPVEFEPDFRTAGIGLVPAAAAMWVLSAEEEGDRPRNDVADQVGAIPLPSNVEVGAEPVAGSGGSVVRLLATFDAYVSPIYTALFVYSLDGGTTWQPFDATDMANRTARTPLISAGQSVEVTWYTLSSGGGVSAWYSPPITVLAATITFATTTITFARADITWEQL